jgi:hypothetical protein
MIGQYLSQINESATVPVLQKFFGTKQGHHQYYLDSTLYILNYKTFDFFILSLTTRLSQI